MQKQRLTISRAKAWLMGIDPVATGRQLRSMRRKHNLTQEMLSRLFEEGYDSASRVAISNWETGKKLPSLEHVVFLAELYGCSLDELVVSYRRSRVTEDCGQPVPLLVITFFYLIYRGEHVFTHVFASFCNPAVFRTPGLYCVYYL